jgi:hypothetical protein
MSICYEIGGIYGASGSARVRKEEGEQGEGKASPELAGIGDACCQYLRPSERNFDGLATQFKKKKREESHREEGVLWGAFLALGARVSGEIRRWGRTPSREGREGLEVGDDRWGPPVSERRGAMYPFRIG